MRSTGEWAAFLKSERRPTDIPTNPNVIYKHDGWVGYRDWLGTGFVARQFRTYRPFRDARAFVRGLGLRSVSEWSKYCQCGAKPEDVPSAPRAVYLDQGWAGYGDWLGTGTFAPHLRTYRSFEEAREFVHTLGFPSEKHWRVYCTSGNKPSDIPANPQVVYRNQGWIGLGDWLGTGTLASRGRAYRPFDEARTFARTLGLRSEAEWRAYRKSGRRPNDIPSNPNAVYKDKGWNGMTDWLGTAPTTRPRRTNNRR